MARKLEAIADVLGLLLFARIWGRIVVRVVGSWITAIGLLMLGWAVRSTSSL